MYEKALIKGMQLWRKYIKNIEIKLKSKVKFSETNKKTIINNFFALSDFSKLIPLNSQKLNLL